MARAPQAGALEPFIQLNPWRVAMLPEVFRSFQRLAQPSRDFAKFLAEKLKTFPPDAQKFEIRHDLNAPVVTVRAVSEPHLRIALNAEYHLLRGECIVVHLEDSVRGGSHENKGRKGA